MNEKVGFKINFFSPQMAQSALSKYVEETAPVREPWRCVFKELEQPVDADRQEGHARETRPCKHFVLFDSRQQHEPLTTEVEDTRSLLSTTNSCTGNVDTN